MELVGDHTEDMEVPGEPGSYFTFRPLTGSELEEAD